MTRTPSSRNRSQCAQLWEIEAARDGRISGGELGALARHAEHCAECRKQSNYLEGLGRALRAFEAPEVDDVGVRRLRQQVLARADAEVADGSLPPPTMNRRRSAVPALAFAVMAALLAFVAFRWARVPAPQVAAATTVDAVDEGGARWTRRTEGEVERVELNDGTLRIRVQKTPGGKRVVVRVPDGEIEDLGTVFHVVVSRGRTQRVGVDEGRVTIRLANAAPITISSGQIWERPEDPAPTAPLGTAPAPATTPSSSPILSTLSTRSHTDAPQVRPAVSGAIPMPPPNAAKEDAAYLQGIRLLREGHDAEAKAAAKEYLRRFPDGFRREEMGRLAQ